MPFDAIVHAPHLRPGARLNIAAADQAEGSAPDSLAVGAAVRIKFGVCCPDLANGTIVGREAGADRVVLSVGGESFVLIRGGGGVRVPGLVSEDWFVAEAAE